MTHFGKRKKKEKKKERERKRGKEKKKKEKKKDKSKSRSRKNAYFSRIFQNFLPPPSCPPAGGRKAEFHFVEL